MALALALVVGTMAFGLYSGHYFVVFAFVAWGALEAALGWPRFRRWFRPFSGGPTSAITYVLSLYRRADAASETALARRIEALQLEGRVDEREARCLERLKELAQLRGLAYGEATSPQHAVRRAFAYAVDVAPLDAELPSPLTAPRVAAAAAEVADLYWKLLDTCSARFPELTRVALTLYRELFGVDFDAADANARVGALTDLLQREGGAVFLILNLVRRDRWHQARTAARELLSGDFEIDDDVRSALYWIAEITWFSRDTELVLSDFDACIRHLYHLCFTTPDRAGMLEIDSRFFSQFETVNELAREGFLYKESLFDRILALWADVGRFFDAELSHVCSAMTQSRSKIFQDRESWLGFWNRERDGFSKDYLYVIEGNLSYASGHYEDAALFFEKALACNGELRAARLNLVFAYARLGRRREHERAVEAALSDRKLHPAAIYTASHSYLLMGDRAASDAYSRLLEAQPGWERKADFYKSTFCFENGLYAEALTYGRRAHEASPEDSAVRYHLSLCYEAVGQKDMALDVVRPMTEAAPQGRDWLNYYRFRLERDAGRDQEASETLLRIPSAYFEDPDELEEALEFARGRRDFVLLRHLKSRPGS